MNRVGKGYTLLELMIVVMLMALITALAAPNISTAIANNTVSSASNRTLVVFRKARTDATTKRAAMRYMIDQTVGAQLIRLDVGADNTCGTFPGCTLDPVTGFGSNDCGVAYVDFSDSYFSRRRVRIAAVKLNNADVAGTINLCITPSGKMYRMTPAKTALTGPLEIVLDRTDVSSNTVGVERRVVVTSTTSPRLML